MLRGVCYDCYRRLISAKVEDELKVKAIEPTTSEQDADALHDHIESADTLDWLGSDAGPQIVNGVSSPEWWDAQEERSL